MLVEETQSDDAVLDYAMCVNKVLHMQRVFLTERETGDKHPCQTSSAMVLDEGTEGNDASVATSSSLATDAAVASSSDPQADRSDEVILPTHTVMNTCD